MSPRIVNLVEAGVLLLAAQQGLIELDENDRAFIAATLNHALKAA